MIYYVQGFDNSPLPQVPEHVTRLYGLILNPMRGRAEEQRFLAASESRDELVQFEKNERASEPYQDEQWRRAYLKGGPLEWFNPPYSEEGCDPFGCGIVELRRDGWRIVG